MASRLPSYYLNETKLYAESIVPNLKNWYANCKRPGEFQRRINAIIPTTITQCTALIFFPKTAAAGIVVAGVMPVAIDHLVLHNQVIQGIDNIIDKNLTATQKKIITVAGIAMAGLLIQDPYLQALPSLFIAKLTADAVLSKYYERI